MTPREIAAWNQGVLSVADLAASVGEGYRGRRDLPILRQELIVSVCEALAEAAREFLIVPDDHDPDPAGGAPRPRPPIPANDVVEECAA